MKKYLMLAAILSLSALTGCAGGRIHDGMPPRSDAKLGPVPQYDANAGVFGYSVPRPPVNVGPKIERNRAATDSELGINAILDAVDEHKLKEVVLDDPAACKFLFDNGIRCTVDNGKLTPAMVQMLSVFQSTNLIEIGKRTYVDV